MGRIAPFNVFRNKVEIYFFECGLRYNKMQHKIFCAKGNELKEIKAFVAFYIQFAFLEYFEVKSFRI